MKETISGARVTKGQFSPLEAPCFSLLNFSGLHGSLHRPPLRHTSSCACSLLPFSFLKFFEKQKISSYKNLSKCYFYLSLEKKKRNHSPSMKSFTKYFLFNILELHTYVHIKLITSPFHYLYSVLS